MLSRPGFIDLVHAQEGRPRTKRIAGLTLYPLKIGSYVTSSSSTMRSRINPAIEILLCRGYFNYIPLIPTQMHLAQINAPLAIHVRREDDMPMS